LANVSCKNTARALMKFRQRNLSIISARTGRDPVKAESIVAANATLHPQVIAALNAK